MNDLYGQIEDFQKTLNQVVESVETAKALAGQLPDVNLGEASAKVKEIFELCDEGSKNLKNAIAQAEDIQRTLGG